MQARGESAPVLTVTELTKVYRGRKPVTAVVPAPASTDGGAP